jgi:GH25 family lysozyme M1 (1,4-beta-N-acetylmuramidase)
MRVYKPQFVGTALGTRRWSLIGWQQLRESRVESAAKLKADGVVCLDDKNRINHIDKLKAQIDAGTYHVDSRALAHKMLDAKQVLNMLNVTEWNAKPKFHSIDPLEDTD